MVNNTHSYRWSLYNALGMIAAIQIYLPASNYGNYTREAWFHFTDYYGDIQIRSSAGTWMKFTDGIEIEGVRFNSVTKKREGYDTYFVVDWNYV